MDRMELAQHIGHLERDGSLLARAAAQAGLGAPVRACEPWRVRDLLAHLGYVHRWATGHVTGQPVRGGGRKSEAEILASGPPDGELIGWYQAAHADLVTALRTTPPGVSDGAFLPAPSPLAFWARRQAHETAVHRFDAQDAAGQAGSIDPGFAADGIDELLMGFAYRDRAGPQGGTRVLQVRTSDTGHGWQVDIGPRGITGVRRATGEADCVLHGPAGQLYLVLWNRRPVHSDGVTVTGQRDLLRFWRDDMRVTWA
jgi:uncharacterized protein (TIGR03083 family)